MKIQHGSDVWKGVAIEEGFVDRSLFEYVRIVGAEMKQLEGEEERGEFHFHKVEVSDGELASVVEVAMRTLHPSWYFHLVKGKRMKVMFAGKVFDIDRDDLSRIEAVKSYGLASGIHKNQIQIERLFDSPYDD